MKYFVHLTHTDASASLLVGHSLNIYHEPHSAHIVFGRRFERTFFTQIVNKISATRFELVKPVINNAFSVASYEMETVGASGIERLSAGRGAESRAGTRNEFECGTRIRIKSVIEI
ncbi:hypothetical protein EVAR_82214_1 [Eumeta japonica]|uniref:Uncharacterized protein n=1 Tax=Eumeta variegata TaxID=151549 RepID=A0A4C1W7U9_EUMVA|nr:hypothetical protein EVAR_82214_1 [Eumeta japonica]